jgi:hypothetical protein
MPTPLGRSARQTDLQMRPVRRVHEGNQMTKEEALKAMMLLSALESWAFSTKTLLPDYMHEDMQLMLDVLSKIVLEKKP